MEKSDVLWIDISQLALCDKNSKTEVCFRSTYFSCLLSGHSKEALTPCQLRSYRMRKSLQSPQKRDQSGIWTLLDLNMSFSLEFSWFVITVNGSRLCGLAFYQGFAGLAHVLLKVFQHNQCHSHCTLFLQPLPYHVPSSSAKHSFGLAPPSLTDRIYCLPTTFVLQVFILQSRNAMPILFFFLRFLGLVPHRAAFYIKGNGKPRTQKLTHPRSHAGAGHQPEKRPTHLRPWQKSRKYS